MSSSCVSGVNSTNFRTAPVLAATSCQGTIFEWCSATDKITSSPGCSVLNPHVFATKLIASVAPRVNTISSGVDALIKLANFCRASSYADVALAERA